MTTCKYWIRILVALLALAMFAAACGSSDDDSTAGGDSIADSSDSGTDSSDSGTGSSDSGTDSSDSGDDDTAVTDDGDPLVRTEPVGVQRTGRTRAGGTAVFALSCRLC